MMVLASCQEVAEDTAQGEAVVAASGYPSLHTVPPRPQLSYTVEQRRAIVDGLIADRANARYSNQVARYRTGLSSLPPPPAPADPLEAAPDVADRAATAAPPRAVPDHPVVNPATEFVYEDDDLDSFMEEMVGGGVGPPDETAPGPESNAAPLGSSIVRASAARPVIGAAAQDGRAPGAVWAIPADTAGPPDMPLPPDAPIANASPAADETELAGRAPGVVWGMVDMTDDSAARAAGAPAARAETTPAPRPAPSGARKPVPAATAGTPPETGRHAEPTAVAGRAPGVVWGMVDMADQPAAPTAAAPATRVPQSAAARTVPAAPRRPAPVESADGNGASVEAVATVVADRPPSQPPLGVDGDAAGIEAVDGLIAIEGAPRDVRDRALAAIDFAPGSASLPPNATQRLERFLAEAKAPDARIRIVGEADAPALALDRALAVGLALVQSGMPANRLELTLAPDGMGDQARLFLAASAP